jgi:hypothetical protein
LGGNPNARGFSESANLRPSREVLFSLEAFVVFPQEKAKPAVRQGRKTTDFYEIAELP